MKKNNTPHTTYRLSLGKTKENFTKEEHKEYNRLMYLHNRDKLLVESKEHYETNRGYVLAQAKKRLVGKGKINRWFHVTKLRTGAIGSFEEVIGCSEEGLAMHIESQFVDGMSWDNWARGSGREVWHIDHIIAISDGGSDHYTNLQPLWCLDNIRKKFL